jgi:hypothetical protein
MVLVVCQVIETIACSHSIAPLDDSTKTFVNANHNANGIENSL